MKNDHVFQIQPKTAEITNLDQKFCLNVTAVHP